MNFNKKITTETIAIALGSIFITHKLYCKYKRYSNKHKIYINGDIDDNMYEHFMNQYSKINIEDDIEIHVKSHGGLLNCAYMISRVIQNHKAKTTSFIHEYAKSSGTVIALSCSKIMMTHTACISKIDPQIDDSNLYNGLALCESRIKDEINEPSQKLAEYYKFEYLQIYAENIVKTNREMILKILNKTYETDQVENIVRRLFDSQKAHGHLFFYEDVVDILNIELIN